VWRERRSQKHSKEKIGCQFYELKKSFKLHPHLDQRERERKRKWGGEGKISKEFQRRKMVANLMKVSEKERKKLTKLSA
jgi:hypothetical protein